MSDKTVETLIKRLDRMLSISEHPHLKLYIIIQ